MMRGHLNPSRSFAVAVAAVAAMVIGIHAQRPANFIPDGAVKGSALTGWHVVGDADWKAENGELVGKAKPGANGGWLVMDKSFQDVEVFTNYRCTGACTSGVLLRAQKTAAGGLSGVYVSLTDGDLASYAVAYDAQGKELTRVRIVAAAPGAGTLKPGEWNPVDILLSAATLVSPMGSGGTLDEKNAAGFGPIALYVGGTGEVRYKDVAWKDLNAIVEPRETVSPRYTMQRINSMYYGWSAASSDINHDGVLDIVAGPFYFLGPNYTERKIYREGRVYNPSLEYAPDMVNLTADFTGDGWPDILSSSNAGGRPMDLYVNPKGESRRWDKYRVLPTISTEIVLMRDLDRDGKPEILFGGGGLLSWARPDPANPTAAWTSHPISSPGQTVNAHGLGGVGDVNGDGRLDVVGPTGWYEQPAEGIAKSPWTFHHVEFGIGAGEMGVYDVNGDGLTDVVTGTAHNWGLNWFEQKKAADGTRTFVPHSIAQNFATTNAGNVVFSQSHAARFADMDGDGIPDFITGKRYWSHLENYGGDPDPYGAAVLYIYKTVRNPKAPGGAEFVPELVHNASGVGSAFEVVDLNNDGKLDIVTSGGYGTFVFLSKPGAARSAARK